MTAETTPTTDSPLDTAAAMNIIKEVLRSMADFEGELAPHTRIDLFFRKLFSEVDIDYLEFQFSLESKFGIRMTDDDWNFLSGWNLCKSADEWEMRFASMFTFGRLAELIASRAKMMRVEPVTVLGSTSHAAGVFQSIQQIAEDLKPEIERFAPSTYIADRLRFSELKQFWARVRVLCPQRVPPLESARVQSIASDLMNRRGAPLCLLISICIVASLGFANRLPTLIGWPTFVTVVLLVSLGLSSLPALLLLVACKLAPSVSSRVQNGRSVLPKDLETFGDLARLVAGDRGGWCDSCGYDLTGVESGRCPECGRETTPPLAMPFRGPATSESPGH